jgi:uroporphyrinogen decarboxylase
MIRGEVPQHTPVWFMRQAGRSQAEYRRIKAKYSLFEITRQPELCAYITKLPVDEYNVDAAILYKDIMTPLVPIGVDVDIKAGVGPVIANPIRSMEDVARLRALAVYDGDYSSVNRGNATGTTNRFRWCAVYLGQLYD